MVGLVTPKTKYNRYEPTNIYLFKKKDDFKICESCNFHDHLPMWKKFVKLLGLKFCLVNFPMILAL